MKDIKLFAYFADNLGDDLMIHVLLKKYPQCRFWFDGVSPASNRFLSYPNFLNRLPLCQKYGRINHLLNILTFYKREDFFLERMCRKQSKKCAESVLIGGSMFMQNPNHTPEQRVELEERRTDIFPRFVIGANFGPYQDDAFRDEFVSYFQRCQSVTFRDRYSCALFKEVPSVTYAPDVVLALDETVQEVAYDDTVVISVIDAHRRPVTEPFSDDYENFLASFCEVCINRGKKPILMSFCENEGDVEGIQRVKNLVNPSLRNNLLTYEYKGDIQEALGVIARASFVLATRFHAMILALKYQKPFYCISYNPKIQRVLEDIHSDAYCGMEQLREVRVTELLDRYTEALDVTAYINQAANQFRGFERSIIDG